METIESELSEAKLGAGWFVHIAETGNEVLQFALSRQALCNEPERKLVEELTLPIQSVCVGNASGQILHPRVVSFS